MNSETTNPPLDLADLEATVDAAARQVPPAWPLASSVAVNPFLGQAGLDLAETGTRLARIGGVAVTRPRAWYLERVASGAISEDDLDAALRASPHPGRPANTAALRAATAGESPEPQALPTLAELAAQASGTDWPGLITDRIGAWAGSWFDEGQALWSAPRGKGAWSAWCAHATHDLTPEIMGLSGFAAHVTNAPRDPLLAMARAVHRLGLAGAALESFLHRLLFSLGGWAQFARQRQWRAELAGGTDTTITELLAIRLLWEEALLVHYEAAIGARWETVRAQYAAPAAPAEDAIIDAVLQEAAERSAQRALIATLDTPGTPEPPGRPSLQAAFCIDVRSEIFRRALESLDPSIRTIGFAGFFGMPTEHRRFASDVAEHRLPVLLNPGTSSCAGDPASAPADRAARHLARARRAWGRFKLAAVSSFAFVEATGPIYLAKLLCDALGRSPQPHTQEPAPRLEPQPDLATRTAAAESVLRAMSLTRGFARLVLVVGHGASVVNNPHASALHCGACGGYSGEVNARLLAGLLNDPEVREGLNKRGIEVAPDTLFVAARHDTTTDGITLYDADLPAPGHAADLARARSWLAEAGALTRAERARRLPGADDEAGVAPRARDWSQIRPEWALAGCNAFIAAPRRRTAGRDLAGRAFLHDYAWETDAANGYPVLELIMTAPVVVASWISLQYYGSAVAPDAFGAGNKLLHNVVGGFGVFEGNGGMLRAGLPWQSVHDGQRLVHDPLRLSVCIEAPCEAMNQILERHEDVRTLFENRWLHLFAIDERGRIAHRYLGDLTWQPVARPLAASTADTDMREVA